MRSNGRTDKRDEANRYIPQFCELKISRIFVRDPNMFLSRVSLTVWSLHRPKYLDFCMPIELLRLCVPLVQTVLGSV
jgi:hypothetical protein